MRKKTIHLILEMGTMGLAKAGSNGQMLFHLNITFKDEAESSQTEISEFYILKGSLHTHYVEAPQLQAWSNFRGSLFAAATVCKP